MTTKYYVDSENNFIGGFDGTDPPQGSKEVPVPNHGLDTWDGVKWIPRVLTFEEKNEDLLAQLLEIDLKSIRALREGDQVKINEWEGKAISIRARLKN